MRPAALVPRQATAAPALAPAPDLQAAQDQAGALAGLLQAEFEALRSQSFDRLESLQDDKLDLLQSLQATAQAVATLPEPPAAWAEVVATLQACRDDYRRNEMLVARQLEVISAALRSLQSVDPTASVDLYDRLGQMARRGGRRVVSDA